MTIESGHTYTLCKSALSELLDIYPSIARKGVDGLDGWLLSLAQPDEEAELNRDLRLEYRDLFEVSIRPFMCDLISVVFLPVGSNPRVMCFRKSTPAQNVLTDGGAKAIELKATLDDRLREFERCEWFGRGHTLMELQKADDELFDT